MIERLCVGGGRGGNERRVDRVCAGTTITTITTTSTTSTTTSFTITTTTCG